VHRVLEQHGKISGPLRHAIRANQCLTDNPHLVAAARFDAGALQTFAREVEQGEPAKLARLQLDVLLIGSHQIAKTGLDDQPIARTANILVEFVGLDVDPNLIVDFHFATFFGRRVDDAGARLIQREVRRNEFVGELFVQLQGTDTFADPRTSGALGGDCSLANFVI